MERTEQGYIFKNVVFNKKLKTFMIMSGDNGIYPYTKIQKCSILNEDAHYKGKGEPFKHTILATTFQPVNLFGRNMAYVGLRFLMTDGTKKYLYISDRPVVLHSDFYYNDRKEAEEIKTFVNKIIHKYQGQEKRL